MRHILAFIPVLLLYACEPSEVFGPDAHKSEPLSAEPACPVSIPLGVFPSGAWEDGLGNTWAITVAGTSLSGLAASEGIRGLQMTGMIDGDTLAYNIGFPGQPAIAFGAAHLTDSDHAQFLTLNADGTFNAHGLLHFNPSAQAPTGHPMDLRPQTDDADKTIQGE